MLKAGSISIGEINIGNKYRKKIDTVFPVFVKQEWYVRGKEKWSSFTVLIWEVK